MSEPTDDDALSLEPLAEDADAEGAHVDEVESAALESIPPDASPPSSSASDAPSSTRSMIDRLLAEASANEDPTRRAVLLHEAAELEELAGADELGAARDYLAAYNEDDRFREPLEGLLRILERRRSIKNIGRAIDNLVNAAETPIERARALRARAADAADVRGDRAASVDDLEQAIEAWPQDESAWLALEIEAGIRGDSPGRLRALARRAELTPDPAWAALLKHDVAELRSAEGETEDALDALAELVMTPGEVAFTACSTFERIAQGASLHERLAWVLQQRAAIVLESLDHGPRAAGVPTAARSRIVAYDALLRAAAASRAAGDADAESTILARAEALEPNDSTPRLRRMASLAKAGDQAGAASIARSLVAGEEGAPAEVAPLLWTTIALDAVGRGHRSELMGACDALAAACVHPGSTAPIVPRVVRLDVLLDGSDSAALAATLDEQIGARPTGEGKIVAALSAATLHTIVRRDAAAARAALELAQRHGADARSIERFSRAIAIASGLDGDASATDAALTTSTTGLLDSAIDDDEAAALDFELARLALRRDRRDEALAALAAVPDDAASKSIARLTAAAVGGATTTDASLAELQARIDAAADPASTLSLAVARATLASARGDADARAAAVALIRGASPSGIGAVDDALPAMTAVAATIADRPIDAASTLRSLAATIADADARDLLHTSAAILLARAGLVGAATELASDLEGETSSAARPLLAAWSRWSAPESESRASLLARTSPAIFGDDSAWGALERLAARVLAPTAEGAEDPVPLLDLLGSFESSLPSADDDASRAALLLEAVWPDDAVSAERRDHASARLAALDPALARMTARADLRRAHHELDPSAALAAAERWIAAGGGVPAAIEALAAAEASVDTEAELRGRRALAAAVGGEDGRILAASASLGELVSGAVPTPIDPSKVARGTPAHHALLLAAAELAPPGSDAIAREKSLRSLSDVLVDGASTFHEMAAWSALARRDLSTARQGFAAALAAEQPTRSALEGAVEVEQLAADGKPSIAWADLSERLAQRLENDGDATAASALWETVGHQRWDALRSPGEGERCLTRAFELDPHKKTAFDRVFRALRDRKADDALLSLVARRLEATDDPPEMAKLFWEQARVLRSKGDRDGALNSLENVTMLEPDHVGALALSAEIYVGRQMYEEAASALDRLSRQPVPTQQRLGAGIGAADLYETKLQQPEKSLAVLVALDAAGMNDVAIHERIARAAAKSEDWIHATKYLQLLMRERAESDGRAEAAKLAAAIHRERLDDPAAAMAPLAALLRERPTDVDALEQFLEGKPNAQSAGDTLKRSLRALRATLDDTPTDVRVARLVARTSAIVGEPALRQVALSVLFALGKATAEEEHQATSLATALLTAPSVALDEQARRALVDPEDTGPIATMFQLLGPTIAEALGPTLEALGVGRRERVDPRAPHALRAEIATWAGALGLVEWELYVGGRDDRAIQGVPAEVPAIVVGAAIRAPLGPEDRARLVREIVAIQRGTTIALVRDDVTVAAIIAAACAIGEAPIKTPAYAVLAETQRLMSKAIARKVKKVLPDTATQVARIFAAGGDPRAYRGIALRTLDRAAVLAVGAASPALAAIVGARGGAGKIVGDARAEAALAFLWSDAYLTLRAQLGLAAR